MSTISWMGRYRQLIESIVRHRNAFACVMNTKTEHYDGVSLSIVEWEVFEYIVEHEEDDSSMTQLSERLMIPTSSFSKISQKLVTYGLIEKYQMVGNRKNIILKPSTYGLKFYNGRAVDLKASIFEAFFKELDKVSDEDLKRFGNALDFLTPKIDDSAGRETKERQLIKLHSSDENTRN